MLGRGRGNSTRGGQAKKPVALPNLAVAGKRENRDQPGTSGRGSAKGAKRGRGKGAGGGSGRGRGRGRGGGHREGGRPVFVEQAGIFSAGLNDDGRHDRTKADDVNEFNVVNFGRGKKAARADTDVEKGESDAVKSVVTFESEWLSDEEADATDLAELLKDNFVADLRRGTVMPLVLPLTEEAQFEKLVGRRIKKEETTMDTETVESEASSQNGVRNGGKSSRRRIDSDSDSDEAERKPEEHPKFEPSREPIVCSSQKAANLLYRLQNEPSDDLLLVQLPSTLTAFSNAIQQDDSPAGTDTQTVTVKTEGAPPQPSHCLDRLEDGTLLGKLRVRKSGRVELVVGGMPLDVTCGIDSRFTESVVLIEAGPERLADQADANIAVRVKSEPEEAIQPQPAPVPPAVPQGGDMYVIGKVGHSLICSHDFATSIEMKRMERERKTKECAESREAERMDSTDEETQRLLEELRQMELKEKAWAKWTANYSTAMLGDQMETDDST